jgi:hypothetical protein
MDHEDIRRTRLFDLADDERVHVRCQCGMSVEFHPGVFPKRYHTPSDTLIYDLRYRLKCSHCARKTGHEISIMARRFVGNSSALPPLRVVVPFPEAFKRQQEASKRLRLVTPETPQ